MATSSKVRRQMLRGTYRAPSARNELTPKVMSGDELRIRSHAARSGVDERVVAFVDRHGPCSTRDIHNGVSHATPEVLARLVDEGKLVATRKQMDGKPGRPGVIWSLV